MIWLAFALIFCVVSTAISLGLCFKDKRDLDRFKRMYIRAEKRYAAAMDNWEKSLKLVDKAIRINCDIIKHNKTLIAELSKEMKK